MDIEVMEEIESLNGGILKQSDLDALGFERNSEDFETGVYMLYSKQINDRFEVEVNFILGEGKLFIKTDDEDVYLESPLLFKNGEQLKNFVESFTD